MLETTAAPAEKALNQKKPYRYGSRYTSKERRTHLFIKIISLLLTGAVSAGSLGLVSASALPPQPAAARDFSSHAADTVQLALPFCSEKNLLPCGSEVVSALMVLHYWGIPTSLDELVAALQKQPLKKENGIQTGPNPENFFAGDPRQKGSMGCFVPPLQRMISKFLPPILCAENKSGIPLEQLEKDRLAAGEPVLIWATANMEEPNSSTYWKQPDGSICKWIQNTACMILTGYDGSSYWVDDPSSEKGPIRWDKALVQKRYQQIGKHCLIIRRAKQ